jgi:UDP-glucose 6-dehydrogenase
MNIGIIGNGFCGKATSLFMCSEINLIIYDLDPNKCYPLGTTFNNLTSYDIIFICINTPLTEDNTYYLEPLDKIIDDLHKMNYYNIVVRSTVTPDYCKSKGVVFFPEFLTEKNWNQDFYNCPAWIIGIDNENNPVKDIMMNIINTAHKHQRIKYNNIIFTTSTNASLCKLVRNSFLATKVSFFNEIYQLCNKIDINYNEELRDLIIQDPRIGASHTMVPCGGQTGFSKTCFPKDSSALSQYIKDKGAKSIVLDSMIYRNETIDRPEQEWRNDSRSFKRNN